MDRQTTPEVEDARALADEGSGGPDTGAPGFFSTASSFPTEVGPAIGDGDVRGYYIDFTFKTEKPSWPPDWLVSRERVMLVAPAQWALGAYERYLAGQGEEWLAATVAAGEYLLRTQQRDGRQDGAWMHQFSMPHTYRLEPPWISAMAQGECASVLVRLYQETAEERYADAARRALTPMVGSRSDGGVKVELEGGPFFEEYPTDPPSYVLNGGIFALWGLYDVAVGLDNGDARKYLDEGVAALARNIQRWDTGYWSRYDLFPHPIKNVASSAYHALHTAQLRAMNTIAPRREFDETAARFESYSRSRAKAARAFATKSLFRFLVPRNRFFAHRLPWSA